MIDALLGQTTALKALCLRCHGFLENRTRQCYGDEMSDLLSPVSMSPRRPWASNATPHRSLPADSASASPGSCLAPLQSATLLSWQLRPKSNQIWFISASVSQPHAHSALLCGCGHTLWHAVLLQNNQRMSRSGVAGLRCGGRGTFRQEALTGSPPRLGMGFHTLHVVSLHQRSCTYSRGD